MAILVPSDTLSTEPELLPRRLASLGAEEGTGQASESWSIHRQFALSGDGLGVTLRRAE